jgi:hypothetical protein
MNAPSHQREILFIGLGGAGKATTLPIRRLLQNNPEHFRGEKFRYRVMSVDLNHFPNSFSPRSLPDDSFEYAIPLGDEDFTLLRPGMDPEVRLNCLRKEAEGGSKKAANLLARLPSYSIPSGPSQLDYEILLHLFRTDFKESIRKSLTSDSLTEGVTHTPKNVIIATSFMGNTGFLSFLMLSEVLEELSSEIEVGSITTALYTPEVFKTHFSIQRHHLFRYISSFHTLKRIFWDEQRFKLSHQLFQVSQESDTGVFSDYYEPHEIFEETVEFLRNISEISQGDENPAERNRLIDLPNQRNSRIRITELDSDTGPLLLSSLSNQFLTNSNFIEFLERDSRETRFL